MNSALDPAMWMRRRRVLSLPLLMVLAPAPLLAQEVLPLKPNEPIDFPGGSFTLLGLDIQRTQGTAVTMRVRVQAGPKEAVALRDPTFRLLAAGVPRQPSAYPVENVAGRRVGQRPAPATRPGGDLLVPSARRRRHRRFSPDGERPDEEGRGAAARAGQGGL